MADPAEELIRQALCRRAPPTLGPTLSDDILRRIALHEPPAVAGRRPAARRWLAVSWLVAVGASLEVLGRLPWSEGTRAVAWGLVLPLVPLACAAYLWPDRAVGLVVLCGRLLLGGPPLEPRAVSPGSTSRRPVETQR